MKLIPSRLLVLTALLSWLGSLDAAEPARLGFAEIIGEVRDWKESEPIKTPWNGNGDSGGNGKKFRGFERRRNFTFRVTAHRDATLHTLELKEKDRRAYPLKAGQTYQIFNRPVTTWGRYQCSFSVSEIKVDWSRRPTIRLIVSAEGNYSTFKLKPSTEEKHPTVLNAYLIQLKPSGKDADLPPEHWPVWYLNNWVHFARDVQPTMHQRYLANQGSIFWSWQVFDPPSNLKGNPSIGTYRVLWHPRTKQVSGVVLHTPGVCELVDATDERLRYSKPPLTSATANRLTGPAPLKVDFSGVARAPDGNKILWYSWDFDGSDGVGFDATGPDVSHTFEKPGKYVVSLTAMDATGQPGVSHLRVTVKKPVASATARAGVQPRFSDVTAASGMKVNTTYRTPKKVYGTQTPHGVAVEDFDGDGLVDIILVCFGEPYVQYFRNLGKLKFQDVTKGSGLESFSGWGTGAAVADFDRDGILDIYLTSVQPDKKREGASPVGKESRLFRGLGKGKFVDVSLKTGTLLKRPVRCAAWSDIDGDGAIDLFVACPGGANVLYHNRGDGTFVDIAESAGVSMSEQFSLGCAFGDIDGDGLEELFVANYFSQVSGLFKNLGAGKFRNITQQAGVGRKAASVGCVFADVFNRGRLDLYVTTDSWLSGVNATEEQLLARGRTVEPNILYRNIGRGRFAAVVAATLNHKTLSHDAILQDLDHDGTIDIYVGVDAIPTGNKFATSKGGNPVWMRPDGKAWKEVRAKWGVGFESNCVCVPAADFDNDGDLDLLLVNFYKNVVLYRNNTNGQSWLRVKPIGTRSSVDGNGARVQVFDTRGGKSRLVGTRFIQAGDGYGRSSPLEAHFGLGRKPAASYRVEVYFPATRTKVVRDKVSRGQRIEVREPVAGKKEH